ncbi:MAG: hypothetical protein AB7I30_11535, partial [Isosphaeraceae bacterium]
MIKSISLLLLCAPLGWFAWVELNRVTGLTGAPRSIPLERNDDLGADDPSPTESSNWDAVVPDEAVTAFLTLGPPPSRDSAGRMTQALYAFAVARKRVDQSEAVEKARSNDARARRELDDLRQALIRERVPTSARVNSLQSALDDYQAGSVFDAEFAEAVSADVAMARLDLRAGPLILDQALASYAKGTPEEADFSPDSTEIRGHLKEFEAYLKRYGGGGPPGPSAEALAAIVEREALWRLLLKLAEGVEAPDPETRLVAVAKLATEPNTPSRFRSVAAPLALKLADQFLKPEPLDRVVELVFNEFARSDLVERDKLRIYWHDPPQGVPQGVTLEDSPLDEFAIKREQVEYFATPTGTRNVVKGQDAPPLKPTRYSVVIAEFNALRGRTPPVTWNEAFLYKLLRYCEGQKDVLAKGGGAGSGGPTLIER